MTLKNFLSINGIMLVPFGVMMLFIPAMLFPILDVNLDVDGLIMASTESKILAINTPSVEPAFINCHSTSANGSFEIKEHIDFCFTCMSKTLEIEKQIAVILKDIYHFEVK